jgi:D-xylose transport system substrate-binding protein
MNKHINQTILSIAGCVAVALGGCDKKSADSPAPAKTEPSAAAPASGGGEGGKIGLLLPEDKTARYEALDKPLLEKNIKAGCPKCELLYQNAQQDASKQLTQADSLLSQGVKVLILDPVDAKAAGAIVEKAKAQKVAVIAYDRFASGPLDYFITFDNENVGKEQGKALLEALKAGGDPKRGQIVMINGSPTDPNAADFKKGAHSVLDGAVNIGFEINTPDWSPDKAQQEMEQALTKVGAKNVIGVYCANDGTASGAIAALKGQGIKPLPPITGQDAELAGIQRVLAGDQYMTIYKPVSAEADAAAKMAVALVNGKKYDGKTQNLKNGTGNEVPSVLLPVVAVTKANVNDTVIKDGVYKVADVCGGEHKAGCDAAGIK